MRAALDTAQRLLDYLPLPAYAITRDGVIQRWNLLTPRLFGITDKQLHATPDEERNVLRYIFDPSTPVYQLLTNYTQEYGWWRYTAALNIFRFKTDNFLMRNNDWYARRVANLRRYPEFEALWKSIEVDMGMEEIRQLMPERLPFPEYVTKIYTPNGQQIKIRGLQMRVVDIEFPRIIAYVPDDTSSVRILTQAGLPTPLNRWTNTE